MSDMRLAIVGCHVWAEHGELVDPEIERSVRERVRKDLGLFRPEEVISGGAEGVDTWVELAAREMGYVLGQNLIIFKPLFPRWEPQGYRERNINIAKRCTDLLSIRCGSGPCKYTNTYGAGWTADFAEKRGKVVRRILV